MRRLALIAALILLAAPQARAADPQPGDACSTANQTMITGGAENSGTRDFLICNVPSFPTWTAETASSAIGWGGVTYGNGQFVAVSGFGTHVMTSLDGVTWTAAQTVPAAGYFGVTYGNGLFVAVAGNGPYVMTSPDGITWTTQTGVAYWLGCRHLRQRPVRRGGSRHRRREPGDDFARRHHLDGQTAAEANIWYSVTYGNGLFVAVAGSGTHRVMTSPDGITWTARTAAAASSWYGVTYGNGLFVAVADTADV